MKKRYLIIVTVLVIAILLLFTPKVIDYLEVRQKWNEELYLIKDQILYSYRHDRFIFAMSLDSYNEASINWKVSIREPVYDKKYNKYNFIRDSGRFSPNRAKVYSVETSRFIPTKHPQVNKKVSYEEFIEEYGVALPPISPWTKTNHIYVWDNRYVFCIYNELGYGTLYDLRTREEVYELFDETYEYDEDVDNSINIDGKLLPELIMTEDGALLSVYKRYNNVYIRLLN